jgi:hypothetical protein
MLPEFTISTKTSFSEFTQQHLGRKQRESNRCSRMLPEQNHQRIRNPPNFACQERPYFHAELT